MLANFPTEILLRVFSFLEPQDVLYLAHDPFLGPFSMNVCQKIYLSETRSKLHAPVVSPQNLKSLLEVPYFQPHTLVVESKALLKVDSSKFKHVFLQEPCHVKEVQSIRQARNLTGMRIFGGDLTFEALNGLTHIELEKTCLNSENFPNSLEHLRLKDVTINLTDLRGPHLKSLTIDAPSFHLVAFLLPQTIEQLSFEYVSDLDLYGIEQLKRLKKLCLVSCAFEVPAFPPSLKELYLELIMMRKFKSLQGVQLISIKNCFYLDLSAPKAATVVVKNSTSCIVRYQQTSEASLS